MRINVADQWDPRIPIYHMGYQNEEEEHMPFDKELDASGLACPLPIVKTKKALSGMATGQVLRVISTDSGSVEDMKAFADQTGNTLLQSTTEDGKYVFRLRKA